MNRVTKLEISPLPHSVNESEIRTLIGAYGLVRKVVMIKEHNYIRAIVIMDSLIENVNFQGLELYHPRSGTRLNLVDGLAQLQHSRRELYKEISKDTIYVKGLNPETKEEALKAYFAQFGSVIEASVVYDFKNTASRCFGFVKFEDRAVQKELLTSSLIHIIDNYEVKVEIATTRISLESTNGDSPGHKSSPRKYKTINYTYGPPGQRFEPLEVEAEDWSYTILPLAFLGHKISSDLPSEMETNQQPIRKKKKNKKKRQFKKSNDERSEQYSINKKK